VCGPTLSDDWLQQRVAASLIRATTARCAGSPIRTPGSASADPLVRRRRITGRKRLGSTYRARSAGEGRVVAPAGNRAHRSRFSRCGSSSPLPDGLGQPLGRTACRRVGKTRGEPWAVPRLRGPNSGALPLDRSGLPAAADGIFWVGRKLQVERGWTLPPGLQAGLVQVRLESRPTLGTTAIRVFWGWRPGIQAIICSCQWDVVARRVAYWRWSCASASGHWARGPPASRSIDRGPKPSAASGAMRLWMLRRGGVRLGGASTCFCCMAST